MTELLTLPLLWLLTWLLHSTLLIGALGLLERCVSLRGGSQHRWGQAEALWRLALFGALLTASLQLALSQLPAATPAPQPDAVTTSARDPRPGYGAVPGPEVVRTGAEHTDAEYTGPDLAAPGAAGAHTETGSAAAPAAVPLATPIPATPTLAPAGPAAGAGHFRLPALPDALREPGVQLTLAWLLLAALGATATLLAHARLRRRARALPQITDAALLADAAQLASAAGVRPPVLRLLADGDSPLLMPGGDICLPRWVLQQLDRTQQRAMLAHEIAHLRRHDPRWRLAAALLQRTLFLQPLLYLAARRLDTLAERACDAWAAEQTGAPRALAESLYLCARQLQQPARHRPAPQLALAMAGHTSPLRERINALMEEHPMPYKKTSVLLVSVIAVAVLGALVAAPQLAFEHALTDSPDVSIRREVSSNGERLKASIRTTGRTLKAEFKGKVGFNDSETDLVSLNGTVSIEDELNGVSHRLDYSAGANGQPQRQYQRNGKPQAFDADAQRWLAGALPLLLRETGWDAEARVKRLHARGGNDAVLTEIAAIRADHVRRRYSELLLARGPLNTGEQARLITLVAGMSSDFERREALQALIDSQTLAAAEQLALLRVVAAIGSDFEKREVLTTLAPKLADQPELHGVLLSTLTGIGSDFEARSVIEALAARPSLSAPLLNLSLQASGGIGSDFEARSALEALAPKIGANGSSVLAYTQAARQIDSDFERRSALVTLLENAKLDRSGCAAVLAAIEGMDSDYEIREVLVTLAKQLPNDAELLRAYRKQTRTLGDYERGQAEKALDRLDG